MDWLIVVAATVVAQLLPAGAPDRWVEVLTGFDLIRSQAFEHAAPELLDRIYPPRSELLDDDRRMLESYAARGVVIEDLRMKVLSARPIERHGDRVELEVVDQLSLVRVRLPDGSMRNLPRDRPTRRTIELSLTGEGWRISSVRP